MFNSSTPPQAKEADGDWTHVKSKSRRRKHNSPHVTRPSEQPVPDTLEPRTDNLRKPEEIAAEYHRIRSDWEEETACKEIRRIAKGKTLPNVRRAVCLGIGTFDPPEGGWENKRRTFVQLIAFLILIEALETTEGPRIECFFQDPIFTTSDRAFIESLGHHVVKSPEGFDTIDKDTLLFGVHLYRPIYAKALGSFPPAIFVGTDLDVWDWITIGEPSELASVKNVKIIEETYKKRSFPQDNSTTAFSSTAWYWREETSGDAHLKTEEAEETGEADNMPDKRLKGATEYSTHPPTCRSRRRLKAMSSEDREEHRRRASEYAAIRSCCLRIAKKDDYQRGPIKLRRNILTVAVRVLMEKRTTAGKVSSGVNQEDMVNKHLKAEAKARSTKRGGAVPPNSLKGVSIDARDKIIFGKSDDEHSHPIRPMTEIPVTVPANSPITLPMAIDQSPLPMKVPVQVKWVTLDGSEAHPSAQIDRLERTVADLKARTKDLEHYQIRKLKEDYQYLENVCRGALREMRMHRDDSPLHHFPVRHPWRFHVPSSFPPAGDTLSDLNVPPPPFLGPIEPQPMNMAVPPPPFPGPIEPQPANMAVPTSGDEQRQQEGPPSNGFNLFFGADQVENQQTRNLPPGPASEPYFRLQTAPFQQNGENYDTAAPGGILYC